MGLADLFSALRSMGVTDPLRSIHETDFFHAYLKGIFLADRGCCLTHFFELDFEIQIG